MVFAMVPLKRRKVDSSCNRGQSASDSRVREQVSMFPDIVLFILERKMGASRRTFLAQLGRSKGFQVEEMYSKTVTHIISENNSGDDVVTWLKTVDDERSSAHLLDISWYTDSMREGHPVEIKEHHRLQDHQKDIVDVPFSVPSYACQRRTSIEGHNTLLTDALSVLADNAELSGEEGRGVAFRRAAAVLKALPCQVTRMEQLCGLPCLGEHSLRVIKDIVANGKSSEVKSTKESERYKAMKVLTGIFGVGVKTADRWFREGICNLLQLQSSVPTHTLNRAQQAGLKYYEDLNQPVTKAEADAIGEIVEKAVLILLPGAEITLIGGFRRGKITGHDVDFLITHPEEGKQEGLVDNVVSWLDSEGFLLYQKTTRNSYLESNDGPGRPPSNMDRFERCFSIFKLTKDSCAKQTRAANGVDAAQENTFNLNQAQEPVSGPKSWRAVRVDLVVCPKSQFAFALLGWTGSKLFERDLRRWAGNEKDMSLSSHALFDRMQRRYLQATSEEEIFAHLGLEYIPPSERNA